VEREKARAMQQDTLRQWGAVTDTSLVLGLPSRWVFSWSVSSLSLAYWVARVDWMASDGCSVGETPCTPHATRSLVLVTADGGSAALAAGGSLVATTCTASTADTKKNSLHQRGGGCSCPVALALIGRQATPHLSFKKVSACCSVPLWLFAWTTSTKKMYFKKSGGLLSCWLLAVRVGSRATQKISFKKACLTHSFEKRREMFHRRSASKPRPSIYISACSVSGFFSEIGRVCSVYRFGF